MPASGTRAASGGTAAEMQETPAETVVLPGSRGRETPDLLHF